MNVSRHHKELIYLLKCTTNTSHKEISTLHLSISPTTGTIFIGMNKKDKANFEFNLDIFPNHIEYYRQIQIVFTKDIVNNL